MAIRKSSGSEKKVILQPKQILFDDAKKSDLFDCEFEDGISEQHQARFDMEAAGERILKEDSEDEEALLFVRGLVGDIDGDNPQPPLEQNSSTNFGNQVRKDAAPAETELLFGQIEESKAAEIRNPESQESGFRAYLAENLAKLCRYDKNLLSNILRP